MLRRDSHIIVKTVRLVPTKAYEGDAMSFLPHEKSPPIYFLGFQTCPNCKETVFAAGGADVADEDRRGAESDGGTDVPLNVAARRTVEL